MKDNDQPVQERKMINTQSLKDLAIYLSGVKDGKGNLLPLGTVVLEDLWDAVKYLQGDKRFISEREGK
jgi:hypothetical protein